MRLAFSVAINVDAEILLIDEILAVGDQHFQDKCYTKLEELKNSGKTIVIVTHSLEVVKKLCHRAIWIYKGQVKLDGDPIYVIDEYLDQVAKDHKEKRTRAIAEGKEKAKAVLMIDYPRDFSKIEKEKGLYLFRGWNVTDDIEATFNVFVDSQVINGIERYKRTDVFEVYRELFAGFIDEDQVGWRFNLDLEKLGLGEHKIYIQCVDKNGKVLADKENYFTLV